MTSPADVRSNDLQSGGLVDWLQITRGEAPLVVCLPHAGTDIPAVIEARLTSPWLARKDADWWVDQLYGFVAAMGATIVQTKVSRTVIDVNRDPSGRSLYPGQAVTSLCPTDTFDGEAIYRPGLEPDGPEITQRIATYFRPYHDAIEAELRRLSARFRRVVLYDAHSIRSRIPRLFEGPLPDLNIGTNDGRSCAPELTARIAGICEASTFTSVVDGRFKGGWTTRHYGRPAGGVDAIQMELACSTYLEEPATPGVDVWPGAFDPRRAAPLQSVLEAVLRAAIDFAS